MTVYPSSRTQAEQTIAFVRVLLAVSLLFAAWIDPAQPAHIARVILVLNWVCVGYALGAAVFTWRWHGGGDRLPLVIHVTEIVAFSVFQYFTLGPASPFFNFFAFSMFCGALRWGWKGTLATAVGVLGAYLIVCSLTLGMTTTDDAVNRMVQRSVYLVMVGTMLVYLGRHEERLRRELERVARWPSVSGSDQDGGLAEVASHAAEIMGARHVLLVWEEVDDHAVRVASWTPQGHSLTKRSPDELMPLLPESLEDATLFSSGAARAGATILVDDSGGRLKELPALPLHPAILARLEGSSMASAPFRTAHIFGRVFFSELGAPTAEIVPLTDLVAREIGTSLEQLHVTAQLRGIAATEERLRLGRDLHDGVLQSLTGIRLELRALEPAARAGDESVAGRLYAIERALAIEQRELRMFISGLKPESPAVNVDTSFVARLDALRERLALEWKTPVSIRVSPDVQPTTAEVVQAVPLMVHEAVVNAMKHAHPSSVAVDVDVFDGHLRIVVRDDGCGFDFKGRFDHAALGTSPSTPRSLFDRVTALGGAMSIDSSDRGSRVEMVLSL